MAADLERGAGGEPPWNASSWAAGDILGLTSKGDRVAAGSFELAGDMEALVARRGEWRRVRGIIMDWKNAGSELRKGKEREMTGPPREVIGEK